MPKATKELGEHTQKTAAHHIRPDCVIDHAGMYAHLRACGFENDEIRDQAVVHSGDIVRALIAGQTVPLHGTPGIQLLALAMAHDTIRRGAEMLARDLNILFNDLTRFAEMENVPVRI